MRTARFMTLLIGAAGAIAFSACYSQAGAGEGHPYSGSDLRADSAAVAVPGVERPAVGGSYVDAVFGTNVRRITGAADGSPAGVVPEYSKVQAWNADGSRLLLRGTNAAWHLLDGRSLSGSFAHRLPVGDIEPRWDPRRADRLYYVLGSAVWSYSVAKRRSKPVARVRGVGVLASGAEQELSADGRYLAVHGAIREDAQRRFVSTKVTVVDLREGTHGPIREIRRPVGTNEDFLDYVAITPDGRRVMVMWAYRGADLYTRNMRFDRRLTTWDEHGDFCRDAAGRWNFVQARYRPGPNDEVVVATPLAQGGSRILWKAPRFNLAVHVSCRAQKVPGWAIISTYWDGMGTRPDEVPVAFENEVFALSLKSSQASPQVRRLAHTQMVERSDYFDEPHATVSHDGRVILFASNFDRNVEDEDAVDTYAIDLR